MGTATLAGSDGFHRDGEPRGLSDFGCGGGGQLRTRALACTEGMAAAVDVATWRLRRGNVVVNIAEGSWTIAVSGEVELYAGRSVVRQGCCFSRIHKRAAEDCQT